MELRRRNPIYPSTYTLAAPDLLFSRILGRGSVALLKDLVSVVRSHGELGDESRLERLAESQLGGCSVAALSSLMIMLVTTRLLISPALAACSSLATCQPFLVVVRVSHVASLSMILAPNKLLLGQWVLGLMVDVDKKPLPFSRRGALTTLALELSN